MRKVLILTTLLISFLLSSSSSIESKKAKLREQNREYNRLDRKLSQIAEDIIKTKKELKKLAKKLIFLEKRINKTQASYESLNQKKAEVDRELERLSKEIEKKQDEFISLIADKFSIALVLEELKQPTPKSVMLQEAYKIFAKENSKELESIKKEIDRLKERENFYIKKQSELKREIDLLQKDRDEYLTKKKREEKLLRELAYDKKIYKKKFDEVRATRRALQRELRRLRIVRDDNSNKNVSKKRRRVRYRGRKTISPLPNSKLIKKYGVYIDPVYKFKIFNKSITLKAPYKGAKVRSVLPGEVVFAEDSGKMLGKVVIIEHKNNIHTIYAKLSRLAPGIKVGKRVSKGTVIGKVNSSLIFEVTKNNRHINPLKLIKLN
jgi:murein DD-endopeptidase MepM/ murein hydrolase activator NlpD